MAVARERLGRLRDRHLAPGQRGQHRHLRVGLPCLDLADVEDPQSSGGEAAVAGVADVGDVQLAAVVADSQPVVVHAVLRVDHPRRGRVAHVDGLEGVPGRPGDVEGPPVRRPAALVAEAAGGGAREQPRVPAVGVHVVQVEHGDVGRWVAELGAEQATLDVEQQRLVRAEHRGRDQLVGLHRFRWVLHVQDDDTEALRRLHQHVLGKEQRRVVVRTHAAGVVDVPLDLEAARVALAGDQLGVAAVALPVAPRCVVRARHPAVAAGLAQRARSADRLRECAGEGVGRSRGGPETESGRTEGEAEHDDEELYDASPADV